MTLKVTNLSRRFGPKWILKDVSFEASGGSVLGLFGSQGSGKTTLLRIIAGLETQDGGTVSIDGQELPVGRADRRVEFIPHVPASPFLRRAFGGTLSDTVDAARRQADAIRAALSGDARVILLDDPLCFLDRASKDALFENLRGAVKESGRIVVFAANDIEDLYEVCGEVAILNEGEIAQSGAPELIYEEPYSSKIAALTGRINLIEARRLTSSKTDVPEFVTIDGEHRLFARRSELGRLGAINRNVLLGIRPESISISFGASFPEDNLLRATVTEVKFLGSTTLVVLDAGGLRLEALVLRLVGLTPGEECMVGLPPDRIAVLSS